MVRMMAITCSALHMSWGEEEKRMDAWNVVTSRLSPPSRRAGRVVVPASLSEDHAWSVGRQQAAAFVPSSEV